MCATPWDIHRPRETEVVFKDKSGEKEDQFEDKVTLARQAYIRPKDLEEHGLTRGCPSCDHQLKYGPGRTGKPHSQLIRARMMAELAKTTAGRIKMSAATDRMDRTVGEAGAAVQA